MRVEPTCAARAYTRYVFAPLPLVARLLTEFPNFAELKWIKAESQRLRAEWAAREAVHGLAGYSAFSARTRSFVGVKADTSDD